MLSATVDDGHVDRPRLPLGERERDGDVGVKGAGAGGAGGTDESGAELALEEVLYEAVVPLQVGGQDLCCHLFVWSSQSVLWRERESVSWFISE